MFRHRIRIDYDEATNELSIVHRVAVEVAGHNVRWSEVVELISPTATIDALKAMIEGNRTEVEARAQESAIQHVAAVTNQPTHKHKRIKLSGKMGPMGEVKS